MQAPAEMVVMPAVDWVLILKALIPPKPPNKLKTLSVTVACTQ